MSKTVTPLLNAPRRALSRPRWTKAWAKSTSAPLCDLELPEQRVGATLAGRAASRFFETIFTHTGEAPMQPDHVIQKAFDIGSQQSEQGVIESHRAIAAHAPAA
ncbi:hypothetical protein [Sphingomonas sp. M1-B02]|uniref:hypothetical protein n=1 Tax=Sphingomonas sp. M1-B02 TaxID=3114300 RepID=UPI002240CA03|nr:hypothetical protein [Sphingomonas sp. S6-11]UZK65438.1 hypothetical protein OKW87_13095 [Sphingomonas sp. S6-11]